MPVGTRPFIALGHNKRIFKQYEFTNKWWVGDNKTRPILPKDKGAGIMISVFQCWEFGFGYPLSEEQLEK